MAWHKWIISLFIPFTLLLSACQPVQPASEVPATGEGPVRAVSGELFFPSVPEWGGVAVSLDFDLQETNPNTHEAVGHVNWRNFSPEQFDGFNWKAVSADAEHIYFGEDVPDADPDSVVIVAKIKDKEGWGQGEPGEYAYFWLRDGGSGNPDQWGMRYFSFDPWYEFYPPDSPPGGYYTLAEMQEEDPQLPLASEMGDIVIHRSAQPSMGQPDEEAFLAAVTEAEEAFATGDVARLMEVFADDAVSIAPGYPPTIGKETIEADLRAFFEEYELDREYTLLSYELDGDYGTRLGEWTQVVTPKAGGDSFTEVGNCILGFKKIDGEWKEVWEIWNFVDEMPEAGE